MGRKPTSPAIAPRSPTWFASRSSSSATARSAWPRAVARAPASASRDWQYAVACPMVAAVLVAERDLEVEDLFPVALEAEVPGLDHAGVHGPDRYLVHLLSLHAVEVSHATLRVLARRPVPCIAPAQGRVEADRLEPGVAFGLDAPLLGDLALEEVHLGTVRRHRRERVAEDFGACGLENSCCVVGEDQDQLDRLAGRHAEQRGDALAACRGLDDPRSELVERERWYRLAWDGYSVEEADRFHRFKSTKAAALCTSRLTGAGR